MRAPLLASALALLLLSGCDRDPMDRPGTWRPTSANDANLRAMVADNADLERGREAQGSRGATAARPIARLDAGRRPMLPRVSASTVNAVSLMPMVDPNAGR